MMPRVCPPVPTAVLLALGLALGGCTSVPRESDSEAFAALYKGESVEDFDTAEPAGSPAEAEERGDKAARNGERDRALFWYIRALKMAESPSPSVLYKIGEIHRQRGSAELARLAYEWARREDPEHTEASARLGVLHLKARRYDEAEERLRPVVADDASLWWAHNAMGILRDLDGDYADAVVHYERAHELNPESAAVLNNMGYSQYMAGEWDAAEDTLERALERDRDYERAWRNLGLLYARQGNYEDAVAALERTSETAAAYNDVGYIAMTDGYYAEALKLFEEARRRSPAYYEAANENARQAERLMRRAAEANEATP